jgi:GTP cyclohydrolase II
VPLAPDEIDDILAAEAEHDCDGYGEEKVCVRIAAIVDFPSRFGRFQAFGFWNNCDGRDHLAIVHGNPIGRDAVLTRLHSECLTGDALGSLRCDCRDQLEVALRRIAREECGVLLYLRQEGRGIGLLNKLRAYGLQDRGMDTVDANLALGFGEDEREYAVAAHMLHSIQVRSIRLMTNNPHKVEELVAHGVTVSGRVPHVIPPNEFNRFYLETKRDRSGHLLDALGKAHLPEQGEVVSVDPEA